MPTSDEFELLSMHGTYALGLGFPFWRCLVTLSGMQVTLSVCHAGIEFRYKKSSFFYTLTSFHKFFSLGTNTYFSFKTRGVYWKCQFGRIKIHHLSSL